MEVPVFVVAPAGTADGLVAPLRAAGMSVTAGDLAAALVRCDGDAAPDVVVVDLAIDDDAAAVGELARAGVPVLALVPDVEHPAVLAAVRAGAAGCVARGAGGIDLVDAVRRTAAGEAVFTPGLAGQALDAYGGDDVSAAAPRLTEREADVVRLVVEGLTARQIARRLVLSPRTVENHIQRTLGKLALPGRAALVRYAIENGLV